MKRRLYIKLLLGYLLFTVLAIAILIFFTRPMAEKIRLRDRAQKQYRETARIADYVQEYYDHASPLEAVKEHLTVLSEALDSEVWLVDDDGRLLLNSQSNSPVTRQEETFPRQIEHFSIGDFGDNYYITGLFYDNFDEDMLTTYSPIISNYKVSGYVLVHHPLSDIIAENGSYLNLSFFTVGILILASFLILIIFTRAVYIPIRKITRAADSYAKGDFTQRIDVHSDDELGYLSDTLNYMASELASREEDQRKFISNVSHDFRSPLTSIKGYIEAIQDGTIPPEMQGKYMGIILFETNRLHKLTESLLELNHFGSHGTIMNMEDFDINQMIKTTVLTFEGICMERDLSFKLVLTGEELSVSADPDKIQRVLYNLIDNAVKFSKNGEIVKIETSIKNEKVLISVKDSGIGIPAEDLNKIWERFYKTDLSRGKDKKGTGLGLSIVKEIIQAHGENINVVSTQDVGTEFIFGLPLSH